MSKSPAKRSTDADEMTLTVQGAIHTVRGRPVILAHDLSAFFETTTSAINQYRARNDARFTADYAFQLSSDEWDDLKSQIVISTADGGKKKTHGGSRTPPWAYTEHGVAMMSMGMKSDTAIQLSKVIIDTFVELRRGTLSPDRVLAGPTATKHRRTLQEKIYAQIEQLLDAKLPTQDGATLREEMGSIAQSALGRIKAVLDKPAKENEKITAEVSKILAEAEKIYAETRKINAETDKLVLDGYRARLEFIRDLREMAMQLERDDWLEAFDAFGPGATPRTLPAPKRNKR